MPRAGPHTPRLMGAKDAARYLGISESTLRLLGLPRRLLGSRKLYDVQDLDAYADSLPTEGEPAEDNTCDAIWGPP